jgi:cardiolipin synthase
LNDEANLNVFSAAFAREQAQVFEADKSQSKEVSYTQWKKRGCWKRFMEFLMSPFRSQL